MNKYIIYRTLGSLTKDIRRQDLTGVEYGWDIHAEKDILEAAKNRWGGKSAGF
jgi:hypothetical protein